jgi:hypothetical protein
MDWASVISSSHFRRRPEIVLAYASAMRSVLYCGWERPDTDGVLRWPNSEKDAVALLAIIANQINSVWYFCARRPDVVREDL